MAAPTCGTPTVAATTGGSTTLSVTAPTMSDGDLLIAFASSGDSSGRDISPPSGWAAIHSIGPVPLSPNGDDYFRVWYKKIVTAAGEPSSYDFTLGDSYTFAKCMIVAVTGADDPATTAIVVATDYDITSGTLTVSPGITPTVNDSLILRHIYDARGSQTYTWASSTEILDANATQFSFGTAKTTGGTGGVAAENVTISSDWHEEYRHVVLSIAPTGGGAAATSFPLRRRSFRHLIGR